MTIISIALLSLTGCLTLGSSICLCCGYPRKKEKPVKEILLHTEQSKSFNNNFSYPQMVEVDLNSHYYQPFIGY